MKTAAAFITLVLATFTLPSQAVIVALSPDKDNTIYEESGTTSNGAGDYLFAGDTFGSAGTGSRRALLAFDVATSVPAGATINSAVVRLTLSRTISGSQSVSLHRLTSDWGAALSDATGQEGKGATALAGDATWTNNFSETSEWSAAGGDFIGGASASQSIDAVGDYDWNSTATTVADVQGWLDNPSQNFGWVLIGDEDVPGSAKRFNSGDNASNKPMLLLDYTPVPEPSSTLLGLLGLGLLARRRRS
jgi:MYXO-CTERM domain-containing protein